MTSCQWALVTWENIFPLSPLKTGPVHIVKSAITSRQHQVRTSQVTAPGKASGGRLAPRSGPQARRAGKNRDPWNPGRRGQRSRKPSPAFPAATLGVWMETAWGVNPAGSCDSKNNPAGTRGGNSLRVRGLKQLLLQAGGQARRRSCLPGSGAVRAGAGNGRAPCGRPGTD